MPASHKSRICGRTSAQTFVFHTSWKLTKQQQYLLWLVGKLPLSYKVKMRAKVRLHMAFTKVGSADIYHEAATISEAFIWESAPYNRPVYWRLLHNQLRYHLPNYYGQQTKEYLHPVIRP